MSLIRLNRFLFSQLTKSKRLYVTAVKTDNEEYTTVPQYPPILDLSYEKCKERKKAAVHEDFKHVKTVEEKQIKLNMPKYYGFKCYLFKEDFIPYNSLPLCQHITRTHLVEQNNLPDFYNEIDVDSLAENLKTEVEEMLLIEHYGYMKAYEFKKQELSPKEREDALTTSITQQINRILMNSLSKHYPYLLDVQFDYDSRIESFWFAGGMNPPENIKRYRRGEEWRKHTENEPTDRAIYYFGNPSLVLRGNLPLKSIIPYSEAENENYEVPYFQYDPRVIGTETEHRHAANIPGFWPGDSNQLGLLSFNRRGFMVERKYDDETERKDAIHRQGILGSFAWLNAQANYLGFTTFNDITYPLVTQSVVTNGRLWSFYVYQLNTVLLHSTNTKENPKRNICWATPELKLFESVEDDKIVGFNTDVLKNLLKFYANVPQERLGLNMRPYLSQEEKIAADYKDDDKREWLEREYKYLVSNRPRYKLEYEVYNWEKIYKIDHKTRIMEPRRRPFEIFQKPSNRKLNERKPFYVPKKLRPHLPKRLGRDAKEYFP